MQQTVLLASELIKHFEGLHLEPYRDPVGFWTIGYGHLITRDRTVSKPPMVLSEGQCIELLQKDLQQTLQSVLRLVRVSLTSGQCAALVDFCFNLGAGNLQVSTLLRLLNRGQYDMAALQFPRWVYAGARQMRGLYRRRIAEQTLFLSGL